MAYPSSAFEKLAGSGGETPLSIRRTVARILEQVRGRGNAALIDFTRRFDGVRLRPGGLRVPSKTIRGARVDPPMAKAASATLREVVDFARASMPKDWIRINGHGARVGEKFDALRRVGIYVPGGSVPLVSTVFMTVALAREAGVREIVVCTPPPIEEALLWALGFCGATEIYQVGGAQALAAMAYGTATIRPVDKLFGPGNAYVAEAKRQLFGVVGVDLMAGPSELMILADESTRVPWAAQDLLAQAEHGSGRERIFCVSTSQQVLKAIEREVRGQAREHRGNQALHRVLDQGCWLVHVRNRGQMAEVANRLAPEHLQVMVRSPNRMSEAIHTAGGIFIGDYTPTVLGDFVAGPSHTLPTTGSGRFFSGLRVNDFMRRTSLVQYSSRALARAADGVRAFARTERLPLHGSSLEARCGIKR